VLFKHIQERTNKQNKVARKEDTKNWS